MYKYFDAPAVDDFNYLLLGSLSYNNAINQNNNKKLKL